MSILTVMSLLAARPESALARPSDRELLVARGVGRLTVLPGRLKVARTLRVAVGSTVRFRGDRSASATQCLLRNEGDDHATLVAGSRLDLVALPAATAPVQGPPELQGPQPLPETRGVAARFWDRDWTVLAPRLSLHCEFPRGMTGGALVGELKRVLKAFDFLPAPARSVSVDEVFPPASARGHGPSPASVPAPRLR